MLRALLYLFSISALVCAGWLFVICTDQWLEYVNNNQQDTEISIVEKFRNMDDIQKTGNQEKVSPLVSQADEFAVIIDPPKPPEVRVEEPQPKVTPRPVLAPRPSAKFRILATSCNRDRPEDSIALVSEPGKGEHWAKVGDFIGNFVLERIEPGVIIYRYGSQTSEMAVEMKPPVRIAELVPQVERRSIELE